MKKLILTVTATLACVAAFAQGKLQFATDSGHLVYYDQSVGGALGGTAVSSANLPSGITLVADLFGGTSSTSLSLVSTTVFGAVAGRWTSANTTFASLPAGTPAFFQIQVRDNGHASATNATWYGYSQIFTAVPQPSSFNPIYQATSPVLSTWAIGTQNMDAVAAGFKGAIAVFTVPEPSSAALAGLAIAGLAIFRRRK